MQAVLVFYRKMIAKAADFLRQSSLRSDSVCIDGIGVQEHMPPGMIDRPVGTDGYLLMYFYDPVVIRDQTGEHRYPPSQLMFWHPGDGHYYGDAERTWNHSWIHCCGKDIPSLLAENPIPRNRSISFSYPELFENSVLSIYEELEGRWQADNVLMTNLVENLFRQVWRAAANDPSRSPISERMRTVKRYIDTNYNKPFTLEVLARVARRSVSHLCSEFRASYGCAPIEYRTRLRLHEACRLLRDQTLRISEIAVRVGYHDVYYFSKHFKMRYGMSPKKLRHRIV